MDKGMILCIALTVVCVAVCAVGYVVLPDTVITQVGLNFKPSGTMPKPLALAIPLIITLIGTVGYIMKIDSNMIILSGIGALTAVLILAMNR